MKVSLKVATYNIGTPGGPDNIALKHLPYNEDRINQAERNAAARVGSLGIDVLCLQEVYKKDRPFIQVLRDNGFAHIYFQNDTAIASRLPLSHVKDIGCKSKSHPEEVGLQGQDIAGISFKIGKISIAIASTHGWGFNLEPIGSTDDPIQCRADRENRVYAKTYTKETISLLNSTKADLKLACGDNNNNTHNFTEPFEMYTNAGFTIHEPAEPTNHNPKQPHYPDRVIDHIISGSSLSPINESSSFFRKLINRIVNIFISRSKIIAVTPPTIPPGFDYVEGQNCSDYKPVIMKIKVLVQESFFRRLFS